MKVTTVVRRSFTKEELVKKCLICEDEILMFASASSDKLIIETHLPDEQEVNLLGIEKEGEK